MHVKKEIFFCNQKTLYQYVVNWTCRQVKFLDKSRHNRKTNPQTTTTNPQNHKPTNPNPKTPHKDDARAIYELSTNLIV